MKKVVVNSAQSVKDFFVTVPLYKQIPMELDDSDYTFFSYDYLPAIDEYKEDPALAVYDYMGSIRLFCSVCGGYSNFESEPMPTQEMSPDGETILSERRIRPAGLGYGDTFLYCFEKTYFCNCRKYRQPSASFCICYSQVGNWIMKIGQWPSFADINNKVLEEYNPIFNAGEKALIQKGIGLASHGAHLGAFAYFRRFFEDLVNNAHLKMADADQSTNWDSLYFSDKIKVVQNELPEEFNEILKPLYGNLSKGLHLLSEEECAEMHEVIVESVFVLLEERLRVKRNAGRKTRVKKALQH